MRDEIFIATTHFFQVLRQDSCKQSVTRCPLTEDVNNCGVQDVYQACALNNAVEKACCLMFLTGNFSILGEQFAVQTEGRFAVQYFHSQCKV